MWSIVTTMSTYEAPLYNRVVTKKEEGFKFVVLFLGDYDTRFTDLHSQAVDIAHEYPEKESRIYEIGELINRITNMVSG